MTDNGKIPDLREALEKSKPESEKKTVVPQDFPPPPRDWTGHHATRAVLFFIVAGIIAALIWKGGEWLDYLKAHPFGAGVAIFCVILVIGIIAFAYWRHRAIGSLGERYWDTDRKRKPK